MCFIFDTVETDEKPGVHNCTTLRRTTSVSETVMFFCTDSTDRPAYVLPQCDRPIVSSGTEFLFEHELCHWLLQSLEHKLFAEINWLSTFFTSGTAILPSYIPPVSARVCRVRTCAFRSAWRLWYLQRKPTSFSVGHPNISIDITHTRNVHSTQ